MTSPYNLFDKPTLVELPLIPGNGSLLGVTEISKHCHFYIKRHYYILNKEETIERGFHGHKKLFQFLLALNGEVNIKLEGKSGHYSFCLDDPRKGLYVPPGYWRTFTLSPDAVLSVLVSEEYDEDDYIRDYEAFKLSINKTISHVPYLALDRCHEALSYELHQAFERTLISNDLIQGKSVTEFESHFADLCGTSYAIGCGNGLDALTLILKAFEIGPGDEVIVPANSFIATALAVENCGARSIFVDCDPKTYGIDAMLIQKSITPKTKAIIPVHLYGLPVDMVPIMDIAKKHHLYVIEDAAQAHGALYKNQKVGSLGDAAAFSFYPTKNLGAIGDAGCVVTSNEALAKKIRLLSQYGSVKKYHHEMKGVNSRLDTLQAAVLNIKIKHLDTWNEKRRKLAKIYFNELDKVKEIILPWFSPDTSPVWHVFPIRVDSNIRNPLQHFLKEQGIQTNIHYPIPIHRSNAYYPHIQSLPYVEQYAMQLLSLPLDPFHEEDEIYYVCEKLKAYF